MSQCVEREEEGSDRPESPTSSCVSMKSDRSKGKPPEPGPSHTQTKIPAKPTTDDEDWKCGSCGLWNTAKALRCRGSSCNVTKSIATSWDSITALPLSAADMRKSWHKDFTQRDRDYCVRCLVNAMSTGDPAEVFNLVTDGQNIERSMYESANSREEYRRLLTEKRSELLEKKLMRMGTGSITALPLSAADMMKSWHKDYRQSYRDYSVRLLVEAMLTGDPAEDINLVTDAQNIERNMYESANSWDEYRHLMDEKSSELKKKLMRMDTGQDKQVRTKRPAEPTTDDEDWRCRGCWNKNTAEALRCRGSYCTMTKIISTSWDSITALPLSAADMRKFWHKDYTQNYRDFYVRYLVEDMSTGDPAEDSDLVTDAQNIERNIYDSANSVEEYYKLMDEKRSELRKKKKRQMKLEKKMKSMSQTSTPPLPPGDEMDMGAGRTGQPNVTQLPNQYLHPGQIPGSSSGLVKGVYSNVKSCDSITALPLSAADKRKSWHKDYTQDDRDSNVRWLVKDMSTGDPAEDINDLVTDALNLERNMYESANSEEEYWKLRGELWGKRLNSMESMSQTSTPPLPPGDKDEYRHLMDEKRSELKEKLMRMGTGGHAGTSRGSSYSGYGSGTSRGSSSSGYGSGTSRGSSYSGYGSGTSRGSSSSGYGSGSSRGSSYSGYGSGTSRGSSYSGYGSGTSRGSSYSGYGSGTSRGSSCYGSVSNKEPQSLDQIWDSITALPLSAGGMRKSWHKDITQRSRDSYVLWLVEYMSTGDPAEDIKDLVTDAQNIEKNIYESANSYDEYDDLMNKKWSELRKKSQMKMEMKQSGQMKMKSMDQTSTPPLPPGDKLSQSSSMMTEGQTLVSSSTDLSSQHVQTGSSMTSQREVKKEEEEDEEGGAEGESKKVESQPDVKMEEKPEGTIPLHGEMEDHHVTESQSSLHPSLELQDETDLSSWFSGLRIEESISLPRSHSLPSLSQIPCLENKTSFTAKRSHSVNDVTLLDKTQKITPDIIVVENEERYRIHCTQAGLFQCNVTDLVFKMKTEGDVTYRTVHWDRRLLSQLDKRPAGPLFDIKGSQGSVCQLRFPHCEILSMGGGKSLSVLHVMDDDSFELIKPHVVTETHVIIDVTELSLFGIISYVQEMLFGPRPVQALVSLFYTPPIDDDHPSSILKVLLLPRNVVLDEVQKRRRMLVGEEIYIGNPPCKLIPKQEYTLSTSPQDDSIKIQPKKAEFEVDELSYRDYIETFDVILKQRLSSVSVLLSNSKTSVCPWERDVDLSAAALRKQQVQRTLTRPAEDRLFGVRSSFINSVSDPVLSGVLDRLYQKGVIIREEYNNANVKQVTQDKARFVIDAVRSKGTAASSSMILFLCETDQFLSKHLGLM